MAILLYSLLTLGDEYEIIIITMSSIMMAFFCVIITIWYRTKIGVTTIVLFVSSQMFFMRIRFMTPFTFINLISKNAT